MAADHATEIADSTGGMCQTPGVTLPGPSRRIVVQPLDVPAMPDPLPQEPVRPEREPAHEPEPVREPEREPVPVP